MEMAARVQNSVLQSNSLISKPIHIHSTKNLLIKYKELTSQSSQFSLKNASAFMLLKKGFLMITA